jgi:hypothetical protein
MYNQTKRKKPAAKANIVHRRDNLQTILLFGLVLGLAGTLLAQDTSDKTEETGKAFVVNGRTVDAEVIQIKGRSYVDVESLSRIMNGAVTIEPNRIILTILSNSSAPPDTNAPQASQGLSKDFVRVSIAELVEMRDWRGAIGTMITYGLAVSGAWSQDYHDKIATGLTEAMAAASTDADENALVLLKNEFDKLVEWASEVGTARQALNAERTIDPNTLRNDPVLAEISNCSQSLNAMFVSGDFTDDPSCH